MATDEAYKPRPFLKWAGGKGQLLPELTAAVAEARKFKAYHEPFVGGGALFFALQGGGALAEKSVRLSDTNPRLIDLYLAIRDDVSGVIRHLKKHAAAHDETYYYATRAEIPKTSSARAARLLYLNRTCFNGLFRENSKGEFNVPMGRYKNPAICDEPKLRAASAALAQADIACRPFESVLDHAAKGDFVYFDPPYAPVSATAQFTSYHQDGFGTADQERLADVCAQLHRRKVKFLLSNSDVPLIRDLYKDFQVSQVFATRMVNSRADRRGKVAEVLVRNF
ncbi:MAG: Dam family site-specific DNA-(adenine-N6)-methyltransferase [Candidatus Hydrogenedens sp.]|nr:Dam family site-specific DNA-(adenine-N6)-methyltransferase [Candidatus Hydrogenedens sp.]